MQIALADVVALEGVGHKRELTKRSGGIQFSSKGEQWYHLYVYWEGTIILTPTCVLLVLNSRSKAMSIFIYIKNILYICIECERERRMK